jgi:RNA polymerase sigma-70 factor, ECF subfamily
MIIAHRHLKAAPLMSSHRNQEALAALFEQYKNLVYKTAYLMLEDQAEAEDALQEVFILVYKALPDYDPDKGALSTWLHRITINHCLNRRRRRQIACQPLDDNLASDAASAAELETVGEAVGSLNEKLRAVVILRYYWELPYAEIADILEVPVGTVRSRLNRAIKTLHQSLASEQERS